MRAQMDFENESTTQIRVGEPRLYKVLMLNDDYSSMDFVIKVLMQIFHHSYDKAMDIMIKVHEQGKGLCGVYAYEIAETKVAQVRKMAKEEKFPLRAVIEEA